MNLDSATPNVWLTANEAAAHLKIKPATLLLWTRQRKVPAFALSGTKRRVWRYRAEDLDATLLACPVVLTSSPLSVRGSGKEFDESKRTITIR